MTKYECETWTGYTIITEGPDQVLGPYLVLDQYICMTQGYTFTCVAKQTLCKSA